MCYNEVEWQKKDYNKKIKNRSKAIAKFLEEQRQKHHGGDNLKLN